MKWRVLAALAAVLGTGPVLADNAPPATDIYSYSLLQVDRLQQHSDFFSDSSAGNGVKLSYDFSDAVYLFGQWNKLSFDHRSGSHTLQGIGVGAHQAYSSSTSFYIDLAFLQDKLSASLGSGADDYWRISYGLRAQASSVLELDAAIFTERNTEFGRRPFGERLGLALDFSSLSLAVAGEHTANGNRAELSLSWAYR